MLIHESLILPVYLLKFAFDYQFKESFDPEYEDDICIFPANLELDQIDKMPVIELKQKYSLENNAIRYEKLLSNIIESE